MSILFLDCSRGISEKAFLSGLLDLGISPETLLPAVGIIPERTTEFKQVIQAGEPIQEYLAKPEDESATLPILEVNRILQNSGLPVKFREKCDQIFTLAADHSVLNVEKGQFSEEAIFLVVGLLLSLEELQVDYLYCSPLPVSIPDASEDLLRVLCDSNIPMDAPSSNSRISTVLAAFLACKADFSQPGMRIMKIARAALRDHGGPGKDLRLILGERSGMAALRKMSLLQINLDDITPQQTAYLIDRLSSAGALEVYQVPLLMKKNRMGIQINVVARSEDEEKISGILFRETPTLGIRVFAIDDHPMSTFEIRNIFSAFGKIPVKFKKQNGQIIGVQPEYESCAQVARDRGVPLQQVMNAAQAAAYEEMKKG